MYFFFGRINVLYREVYIESERYLGPGSNKHVVGGDDEIAQSLDAIRERFAQGIIRLTRNI